MHKNGYSIDSEGMCYGIAHVAILSALKGKFNDYENRLEKIQSKDNKLSYQSNDDLDILAFFDEVSCFYFQQSSELVKEQDQYAKKNLKEIFSGIQDAVFVSQKLKNLSRESHDALYLKSKHLKVFNNDNTSHFESFLNTLKGTSKQFGVSISSIDHTIAVVFDNNKWRLISHDKVTTSETLSPSLY